MPYIGYYINLDRSPDRRAAMEAQLARLNPPARYRRFPAVDGNPDGVASARLSDAEIGCLTSNYLLLQMHRDGASHLHLIEDDAVLANRTVQFVEQIIAMGLLDDIDVLFTSTVLSEKFDAFRDFFRETRKAWRTNITRADDGTAIDVQYGFVPYLAGMESYLVNRRSVGLVCDIIQRELERGAEKPVDVLIRDEAASGKLRVRCLFPFITSVLPGAFTSTRVPDDDKQLSVFAMELLRHSFFVECDQRAALELADQLLSNSNSDSLERLHARIAGFVTSDAFQAF